MTKAQIIPKTQGDVGRGDNLNRSGASVDRRKLIARADSGRLDECVLVIWIRFSFGSGTPDGFSAMRRVSVPPLVASATLPV